MWRAGRGLLGIMIVASVLASVPVHAGPEGLDDGSEGTGTMPLAWIPTREEIDQETYVLYPWLGEEPRDGGQDAASERAKALPGGIAAMAVGRSDTKNKPVVIIHGRDTYNVNNWFDLQSFLIHNQGFSGSVPILGYYGGECMGSSFVASEHHGDHNKWYGGAAEHSAKRGCNGQDGVQVHDLDTDIRHLAYHIAWAIHDHFTREGRPVDVASHSMGGVLIRYAIAMSAQRHGDWPPALHVEDVVTLASPHIGTFYCGDAPWDDIEQLCRNSSTMQWLKANAQNPQSDRATDWTLVGSECDEWLSSDNHLGMKAGHTVLYPDEGRVCYRHSDFVKDTSTAYDAKVFYTDLPDSRQYVWYEAPHAGLWASHALYVGTW